MKCRTCRHTLDWRKDEPMCRTCRPGTVRVVQARTPKTATELAERLFRWIERRRCIEPITPEQAALLDDLLADMGIA